MKRWTNIILLFVLFLPYVSKGPTESATGDRLVVFEGFYKVT